MGTQSANILISVCMPMYNAAPFLKECIDSVLTQNFEDFEFVIIDDGSEDQSAAIVARYADSRIRLIRKKHDYIGTLNEMLKACRGRYIARMDADDVMLPDRLQTQFDYMEKHPEVDVWAGGLEIYGQEGKCIPPAITGRSLGLRDLLPYNLFGNPATIIRIERWRELGVFYERDFIYAEDYRFWSQLIHAGANIVCTEQPFFKYRKFQGQTSREHEEEMWSANQRVKDEIAHWLTDEEWASYTPPVIEDRGNKLTVIIPFLNEGDEVVNTVKSIRDTVGDSVDILVINDQSTDGYPYAEQLAPYGVYYVMNRERKGVAASRDYGVEMIRTPYFLLLDAHMRFYSSEWLQIIVSTLETDDRQLLCCQGRYLEKIEGEVCDIKIEATQYGAHLPFIKGEDLVDVKWNTIEYAPGESTEEIAVVLGAAYATSRRYWLYLHGLHGLLYYGSDEAFISTKVWLEGGRCILLKNVIAGHIYRKKSPFQRFTEAECYNKLLIAHILYPPSLRALECAYLKLAYPRVFSEAERMIESKKEMIAAERAYMKRIGRASFSHVLYINRRACRPAVEKLKARRGLPHEAYSYLKENYPVGYGLYNGKTGCLLWLCHYASYAGNPATVETEACKLFADIEDAVDEQSLPFNFKYGLCGIGWTAIYLYRCGLIDDAPVDLIAKIDRQLRAYAPQNTMDCSVETGGGGFLSYILARIALSRQCSKIIAQPTPDLIEKATCTAERVVAETTDLSALAYAFRFKYFLLDNSEEELMSPSVSEWLEMKDFVPQNREYWENGLSGNILTASLRVIISQNL